MEKHVLGCPSGFKVIIRVLRQIQNKRWDGGDRSQGWDAGRGEVGEGVHELRDTDCFRHQSLQTEHNPDDSL